MARHGSSVVVAALAALACSVAFAPFAHADEGAADEHGEHAAAHEGAEGEHENAEFNWAYGFVGEKEGVEPSLLYRPKGMAPPFLANVLNAVILFGILVSVGKKPVAEALRQRKERLVGAMQEAAKMKADSEVALAGYEEKLAHLDDEIERIKREMKESAQAERTRILAEAKERRERMERDAKLLVEQEIKAAREILVRETVAGAIASATELLQKQLAPTDHDRIAKDFVETVKKSQLTSVGGRQ